MLTPIDTRFLSWRRPSRVRCYLEISCESSEKSDEDDVVVISANVSGGDGVWVTIDGSDSFTEVVIVAIAMPKDSDWNLRNFPDNSCRESLCDCGEVLCSRFVRHLCS